MTWTSRRTRARKRDLSGLPIQIPVPLDAAQYKYDLTFSPDGGTILYTGRLSSRKQVLALPVAATASSIAATGAPRQLTTIGENFHARYSKDGGTIVFISQPLGGSPTLYLMNADGSNRRPVAVNPLPALPSFPQFSPYGESKIMYLDGSALWLANLDKEPLTLDKAERHLHDILGDRQPRPITPQVILEATAEMFDFTIEELKGKSRRRPLVTARQIAMYVFRELTDLSYPSIAKLFGGRDHTTVIHAVDKIQRLMKERKQIYDQVTDLVQRLKKA